MILGWDLKSLHWRLLMVANVLAAVGSGLFWVALYVSPRTFSQHPTEEYPVAVAVRGNTVVEVCAVVGGALVCANLLYLLYGRHPRVPVTHVVSEGAGGVRVAREAIESGLRAAGEALDEVTRLRVSLDAATPKKVVVRVQFQAPDGVAIQAVGQRLRQVLVARFAHLVKLPESVRLQLDLAFTGFAGKPPRKEAAPPAEESAPFTGPQYPIDDDDLEAR